MFIIVYYDEIILVKLYEVERWWFLYCIVFDKFFGLFINIFIGVFLGFGKVVLVGYWCEEINVREIFVLLFLFWFFYILRLVFDFYLGENYIVIFSGKFVFSYI